MAGRLPTGAWLTNLGTHRLRDLPRPERVLQLCHRDVRVEFPPLRVADDAAAHGLPVQLTSFVGRQAQIDEVCQMLADNRLVTLTAAGGVGKTRLALQVAAQIAGESGGAWCVDLAPIPHPELVPATMARALGVPDQPGRSTTGALLRFLSDRRALVVLDNCEHSSTRLLHWWWRWGGSVSGGEAAGDQPRDHRRPRRVSWRVPSLSLDDVSAATTPPQSVRFAGASTVCRWRSSWQRRGYGRCRWPRSSRAYMTGSGC